MACWVNVRIYCALCPHYAALRLEEFKSSVSLAPLFHQSYLLLLSVVSSIMPESLPFDELWELCVDWGPRDLFSLSIPPSLSLSPESLPLDRPSMSLSELGPLRSPGEPPDPDPPLGDDSPVSPFPCFWLLRLALDWPLLTFGDFNPSASAPCSLSLSSALDPRPRLLLLGVGLELS